MIDEDMSLRTRSITVECDLDEPPEKVWRALCTKEIVAEWLGPNTLEPRAGTAFEVQAPEAGGTVECKVLDASPGQRLSYSWRIHSPDQDVSPVDSVVTFEIAETHTGGTHLRVIHSGLPVIQSAKSFTLSAHGNRRRSLLRAARSMTRVLQTTGIVLRCAA
ncbi:SRPBCC family protein [Microvirga puerhi]|uniref:SRPBCC domain-containing protein n=1 Tax=Microvirga puerhi TaxID=2876078 RepID=A0ABS7VKH8_9HYPH|nr:SRPBCC domain-containing protein [Microvirga puerhi]MBZ6076038.1 SRPBCC domain-containing protein [Microvirga puerhi]